MFHFQNKRKKKKYYSKRQWCDKLQINYLYTSTIINYKMYRVLFDESLIFMRFFFLVHFCYLNWKELEHFSISCWLSIV